MLPRTRSQVGELVAQLFDRLEEDWPAAELLDAVLVAEIRDPDDPNATTVLIEATTPRTTVREGLLRLAIVTGVEREEHGEAED